MRQIEREKERDRNARQKMGTPQKKEKIFQQEIMTTKREENLQKKFALPKRKANYY